MEKGLQHEHIDVEERSSGVKKGGEVGPEERVP